jgi:hypothetical protein
MQPSIFFLGIVITPAQDRRAPDSSNGDLEVGGGFQPQSGRQPGRGVGRAEHAAATSSGREGVNILKVFPLMKGHN